MGQSPNTDLKGWKELPFWSCIETLKESEPRPNYKSMRQLIRETIFTEREYRFVLVTDEDDIFARPPPSGPNLSVAYDEACLNRTVWGIDKEMVLSTDDSNSPGSAFDDRTLSKMRRHIYRYKCVPIWVVNASSDISQNGPCEQLEVIARQYCLKDFDQLNYQVATNFFAWRCSIYMMEASNYQQRQFVRNRDEFLQTVSKFKSLAISKIAQSLDPNHQQLDVARIVFSFLSLRRRMWTCAPPYCFEWHAVDNWESPSCTQRCSYDDFRIDQQKKEHPDSDSDSDTTNPTVATDPRLFRFSVL